MPSLRWWKVNDILYEMRFYSMIIEFMNKRWGNASQHRPISFEKIRSNKERPNLQYHEKHSANIIKKNECAKFFVMNVDVVT